MYIYAGILIIMCVLCVYALTVHLSGEVGGRVDEEFNVIESNAAYFI